MLEYSMEKAGALIAAQLPAGVFLCAGDGASANVMTIGWGGLTYFWRRHVFVAPIRPQRHTYPLVADGGVFTVCVPAQGTMQEAIAGAGTLSGRDGDKFKALGIQPARARQIDAPVVPGCALYLECVVRAQAPFTREGTDETIVQAAYPAGDYHNLFFGEIIACYEGDAT